MPEPREHLDRKRMTVRKARRRAPAENVPSVPVKRTVTWPGPRCSPYTPVVHCVESPPPLIYLPVENARSGDRYITSDLSVWRVETTPYQTHGGRWWTLRVRPDNITRPDQNKLLTLKPGTILGVRH